MNKKIIVEVTEDMHQEFKKYALENKKTMAEILRGYINKLISRQHK